MTAVGIPGAAPAQPQPRRAPNAWRATSKAERKWLLAPAEAVKSRALAWSLIPGLGQLRYGRFGSGFGHLFFGALAMYLLVTRAGGAVFSGMYAVAITSAQADLTRDISNRSGTEFQERVAAWQWRRRCTGPDCPRCGVHAATAGGFCAHCQHELAPYQQPYLAPQLMAADGISYPSDPSLAAYLVDDLVLHTCLGRTAKRDFEQTRRIHEGIKARTTERSGQVLAAFGEPYDARVAWLFVRVTYRLVNGTLVAEDAIRRARFDNGRVVEVWETITAYAFPEGHPADLQGRPRVDVPEKVRAAMARG